ncbi:gustatory receptor for sugar taste 64e-like isoform X1 [Topomyia yanbarensis]|uniref:gustatory receptor for sugar taste 64e-like isoform X1 n=1 Tax=Topomyia yanbarensis TaxID=2498891 RepID=UPI00273BD5E2|nr:gustatory receptor for sugar taste 64e-like isoform X1 [Topomyia yanbarensis]
MQVNQFPNMAKRFLQNRMPQGNSNKVVRFKNKPEEFVPVKDKWRSVKGYFSFPKRATRDDWIHDGTFHDAIAGLLVTAQFCAVMPVCGITSKDPKNLHFSWTSKRIVYTYAACLGTAFFTVNAIVRFFMRSFTFVGLTVVFFYSYNLYGLYCFIKVARKWPALIRKWHQAEQLLPRNNNIMERGFLAKKIRLIALSVVTMSLAEHLLSIISAVYYSPNCPAIPDQLDKFIKTNFVFIFHFFEYSKIRGFFVKYVNGICTFVWSYIDLFVIVVSIGLSHCYKRINEFLMQHKRKKMTEQFWAEQRQNYRNICDLVQHVDDVISVITMLSISNNLFYICVSILNSLEFVIESQTKRNHLTTFNRLLQLTSNRGSHAILLARINILDRPNPWGDHVRRRSERRIQATHQSTANDSSRGLVSGGETFRRRGCQRYGCTNWDEIFQHDSQTGAKGDRVYHNVRIGAHTVPSG